MWKGWIIIRKLMGEPGIITRRVSKTMSNFSGIRCPQWRQSCHRKWPFDTLGLRQSWTGSAILTLSLCSHWHITSLTMLIPPSDISLVWSIASCLKFNYQRTTYFQSLQGTSVTSMDYQPRPGFLILSLQCFPLSCCLAIKRGSPHILHGRKTSQAHTGFESTVPI